MGQEIMLPDWAKKAPAQAFAALTTLAQDDSLSEGIGQSYPVIGYKGKVWSLRHRGQRHNFIRPDDGTPASYIDVIILGQAKQKSKSLYKAFDPNSSDGDRPICSSIDGVVPDPDVTTKQCDTCALCPKNVWKTNPTTGKKGRDCTDYKRLAVLPLPPQTKAILGEALLEPCFLRIPPASLNSLAIMGDTMASQGFHYSSYITRITFDPNEAHPKMVFRPLQGLTNDEAPVIMKMRAETTVTRITNGDFASRGEDVTVLPPGTHASGLVIDHQPSTAAPTAPVTTSTTPPPTNTASSLDTTTPAQGSGLTTSAQPATEKAPPVSSPASSATGFVDTGFGIAMPAGTAQALPQQSHQTVGDTGAPEATDQDLDAQIASLIKAQ